MVIFCFGEINFIIKKCDLSGSVQQEASLVLLWICQETFGPY